MTKNTLYWFTNDLRLSDLPGLKRAQENGAVLPIYIYDSTHPWPIKGAAAWWLHHSLDALHSSLKSVSNTLELYSGDPISLIKSLAEARAIDAIYCSRAYTPHERQQQHTLAQWSAEHNIEFQRFAGNLLFEPENLLNKQKQFFQVFTPFYKHSKTLPLRKPSEGLPEELQAIKPKTRKSSQIKACSLKDLKLLPSSPNWAEHFKERWQAGENAAHLHLTESINERIEDYANNRDLVAIDGTSKLSAHLRFGEISPAQIFNEVSQFLPEEESRSFLRQLVWRDFNAHLLFHNPNLPEKNFRDKMQDFPWQNQPQFISAWKQGKTGYPLVDAAMQQLWQTGWMHNRARMIVASFLTKHLLCDWRIGARWFWDTLCDADLANNTGGWQWTAGCGADAAPYFRIFNPILQGQRFDKNGDYIRQWLPQLAQLPSKFIHSPWTAPSEVLEEANIKLGDNYPHPIVDHKEAREKALELKT